MRATRKAWAAGALVAVLGGLAVLIAEPFLLAGTAILGAWLLGRQAAFVAAVGSLQRTLEVTQAVAEDRCAPEASTIVTVSAQRVGGQRLACTVRAGLPTATSTPDDATLELERGEGAATTTVDVVWPVAGVHRFEEATVEASDGLFTETITTGTKPTVHVDPDVRRNFHVGAGGERIGGVFGAHRTGRVGPGIEPAHVREYTPEDTVVRIDWKATARLRELYVREFEAETDRETLVVVDHRSDTAVGEPGLTIIDGFRSVCLALVESSRHLGDPLGLLTVGDGGTTTSIEPGATAEIYGRIHRSVADLRPSDPSAVQRTPHRRPVSTAEVSRSLADIKGDADTFARTLRPFLSDRRAYRSRIEEQPLYAALEEAMLRRRGPGLTVLFTTDDDPAEVREAVRVARGRDHRVLAYIAPRVLYEPEAVADPAAAYRRYVTFEERRRELASMDRVTALEIGPRDRLAEVLAAGRGRRTSPEARP